MPRLNVNMNDATAEAVRELMARHEATATDVIHRAVTTYAYLRKRQNDGVEVRLVSPKTGAYTRVEFIP